MGATLTVSPRRFVMPNGNAQNFNMTGAISMQCLQNHKHFGTACRCNEFGKAAVQRRQSAHPNVADRQQSSIRDSWDKTDSNNNSNGNGIGTGSTSTSRKSMACADATEPDSAVTPSEPQPPRMRYNYHNQLAAPSNDRASHSTCAYPADQIKPSKSMASLKETSKSHGLVSSDGNTLQPALKPALSVSPGAASHSRQHSQAMSSSQSMSQLRASQPPVAVVSASMLNGTLTLANANKRVSNFFARRSIKELSAYSGKHSRSRTADASESTSNADSAISDMQTVSVSVSASSKHTSDATTSRSSVLSETRGSEKDKDKDKEKDKEKENCVFENAPWHNYRQPIPKSISCYNIKSQHHTYYTADALAAEATQAAALAESRGHQRKTVLQASTTELLHHLSHYLYWQSPQLHSVLRATDAIAWVRSADKNLILQGWSDINFINPANVVFIFMLLRNVVDYREIRSVSELQAITMTCLYLAYSYMGNEISYPLKPFFLECDDRDAFWQRCLDIISLKSAGMLRLNTDPVFFAEIFTELKGYSIMPPDKN